MDTPLLSPLTIPLAAHLVSRAEAAELLGISLRYFADLQLKEGRILPVSPSTLPPEMRPRGRANVYAHADVLRLKEKIADRISTRAQNQIIIDGKKRCKKCEQMLPLENFTSNPRSKTGLEYRCNPCLAEIAAAHYQRHKDRIYAKKKAWEKEHPEVVRERSQRYYQRNKARLIALSRAWYRANANYVRAYRRADYRANQEGNPRHFLRFLVQMCDRKPCGKCRRVKSLLDFDRDNRRVDGFSADCLECLSPRKTPPGGYLVELDQRLVGKGGGEGSEFYEVVADKQAVDPEAAAVETVMVSEMWDFVETLPKQQRDFLLLYMETLDLQRASGDLGIKDSDGAALLLGIRNTATAQFGATAWA